MSIPRTVHTTLEATNVQTKVFTSQDFTNQQVITAQPPGSTAIPNVTFTNGSPNLTLADPSILERYPVYPGQLLFEDEGDTGAGLATSYVIASIDPDAATNHIVLTTNWVGTGASLTAYVKHQNRDYRYILDAIKIHNPSAVTMTFEETEADGTAQSDSELVQIVLADNGGDIDFFPIILSNNQIPVVTATAGTKTDISLIVKFHSESN